MTSPEYLYRMRSINTLLGEFQELANQEIYFAPPEELNDAAEGFKDILWSGDEIVWKNLLRHYLLCLEHMCSLAFLGGDIHNFGIIEIPSLKTEEDLPTDKYRVLYQEICDRFFSNEVMSQYPGWFAACSSPIRRNELIFHLRQMHLFALNIVLSIMEKHGLISKPSDDSPILKAGLIGIQKPDLISVRNLPAQKQSDNPLLIEEFYASTNNLDLQQKLILQYSSPGPKNLTWKFILLEFTEAYIKQLERVIHPEWYTACFLESCENPSLWGHYGDSHSGACLKFKVQTHAGNSFMKLHGINGWGGDREKSGPIYGEINHQLYKVKYLPVYPQIDFFRSLGRISMSKIKGFWYRGEDNTFSAINSELRFDEEWRRKYWDDFYVGATTKLEDWSYEKEYRLIHYGSDPRNKNHRKLKYNFHDLDGIIFGVKTSANHKLQIMKVIEEKCRNEKRNDFNFYQATYSNGKIKAIELKMLKFK